MTSQLTVTGTNYIYCHMRIMRASVSGSGRNFGQNSRLLKSDTADHQHRVLLLPRWNWRVNFLFPHLHSRKNKMVSNNGSFNGGHTHDEEGDDFAHNLSVATVFFIFCSCGIGGTRSSFFFPLFYKAMIIFLWFICMVIPKSGAVEKVRY